MDKDALTVLCPACLRRIVYSVANPWRPFCSERCRNHDLGAWASEKFRIPTAPSIEDEDPSRVDE
jgi:endogenous inhibitor of DNA gyrase (YacG/DUF329 family)